jgi:hypothetical protein
MLFLGEEAILKKRKEARINQLLIHNQNINLLINFCGKRKIV